MYGQWGQGYPGVDPAHHMYWQQYYAAAGYSQPQQFYGAYGAPVPGMPADTATAATTGANPVPPAEPPKEERPPLPAEPPPDEEVRTGTIHAVLPRLFALLVGDNYTHRASARCVRRQ